MCYKPDLGFRGLGFRVLGIYTPTFNITARRGGRSLTSVGTFKRRGSLYYSGFGSAILRSGV